MNFQMFKLDLEKAEEPAIKLPTSARRRNFRKTSASLITLKTVTMWIATNGKILEEMGIPEHLTCLLRNPYASQEATS